MKENQNCGHEQDEMCACIRDMSTANQMIHTAGNIRDVSWELDYETLEAPERVRLCIVGSCGKCGKRLCYGLHIGNEMTGETLIESVYTYIVLFHKLIGLKLPGEQFDADFCCLFHELDHPIVKAWMEKRCGE